MFYISCILPLFLMARQTLALVKETNYEILSDVVPNGGYYFSEALRSRGECATQCSIDNKCLAASVTLISNGRTECTFYRTTTVVGQSGTKTLQKIADPVVCSPGFTMFQGHCYIGVLPSLTFDVAKLNCPMIYPGAYLVEVGSTAENSFVIGLTGYQQTWLGLYKFIWTNSGVDTRTAYTQWRPGQPDNPATEFCVRTEAGTGKWMDGYCTWSFASVCEYVP